MRLKLFLGIFALFIIGGWFVFQGDFQSSPVLEVEEQPLVDDTTSVDSEFEELLFVEDARRNEVVDQIAVGETPHGISFSTDRTRAFVPLYEPGEVVVIDVATRDIIKRVKVGQELHNSVVVKVEQGY